MAAPVLALVVAGIITTIVLLMAGEDAALFWETILSVPESRNIVNILNSGSVLYLSGLAAAIGFRMNLFNIGVEGQYRVATFCAALFAGSGVVARLRQHRRHLGRRHARRRRVGRHRGSARVTRGVSEVISTIMLNAIAVSLIAYLLRESGSRQGQTIVTDSIPEGSRVGGIALFSDSQTEVYGLIVVAIAAGVLFWFLINRTVFGFNLRATGMSESAAVASGVSVKRMTLYAMLISGALAGLIGMPNLFGESYNFGSTIQSGIGFAGIAVALLGRNSPVGVAFGALIFAFLNEQANPLGILAGISPDIILITQGAWCSRSSSPTRSCAATASASSRAPWPMPWTARAARARREPWHEWPAHRSGRVRPAASHVLAARGCVGLPGLGAEDLDLPQRAAARSLAHPRHHRGRPDRLGRHAARRTDLGDADRARRARRSLVRAGRRGQHRARGHDDPRHAGCRLLRVQLRRVGRPRRGGGVRRGRWAAPRVVDRHLRRRPHRLRRRDQHHRARGLRLPGRGHVHRLEGGGPTQSPSFDRAPS